VKQRLKRLLSRSDALYSLAATAETVGRYVLRQPVEADHNLWRRLEDAVVFVDVGANRGQTALSFASVSRLPHRIVSFEVNTNNERYFWLVRRLLGRRFEYRMCGLGRETERRDFFVPVKGGRRLTGEGSFDRENIERASRRFGSDYTVVVDQREIRRLDSFAVEPDIVKIDVQGLEMQVVEGMGSLLERQPLLMIEANPHTDEALYRFLGPYGYERFRRAPEANVLVRPGPGDAPLNWFYAAPGTASRFPRLFPG
jgi:FkbM family methyltransferase